MNKDKIQVGDLVTHSVFAINGVGLVIKKEHETVGLFAQRYRYDVYWFTAGYTREHSKNALVKCGKPDE